MPRYTKGEKPVTECDFRKDEFKHADPEDYEFRADGAIVRKDRWEKGMRSIASIIGDCPREYEIDNMVVVVQWLMDLAPDPPNPVSPMNPTNLTNFLMKAYKANSVYELVGKMQKHIEKLES